MSLKSLGTSFSRVCQENFRVFNPTTAHKNKEAEELYSRAIDLNPTNEILFSNRAFAALRQDKFGQAIADATTAIQIKPNYVKVTEITFGLLNFEELLPTRHSICSTW